jgi:hypothetical protein
VAEAKEHFSQQLTAELKRNRFGDPQKSKRAKKANRLPAGLSYTVSAVSAAVEEPVAGKYRYLPYVPYSTALEPVPGLNYCGDYRTGNYIRYSTGYGTVLKLRQLQANWYW